MFSINLCYTPLFVAVLYFSLHLFCLFMEKH